MLSLGPQVLHLSFLPSELINLIRAHGCFLPLVLDQSGACCGSCTLASSCDLSFMVLLPGESVIPAHVMSTRSLWPSNGLQLWLWTSELPASLKPVILNSLHWATLLTSSPEGTSVLLPRIWDGGGCTDWPWRWWPDKARRSSGCFSMAIVELMPDL